MLHQSSPAKTKTSTPRFRSVSTRADQHDEVLANHRKLMARSAYFRRFGYDLRAAIKFILAQALPLGESVLEIGTGKGRFLVELAKHVPAIITVDISPEEQHFARLNARFAGVENKIQFVIRDATQLPWPDGVFDAVVTMNTLHHLHQLQPVLEELMRVVKPDGKLVLADFSPRGFQIMDRVHRAEGRIHQRVKHSHRDVREYFRSRGWATRLRQGCLQEVLIAWQKGFVPA